MMMIIIIKNREQRRCQREREKKNTKNPKIKTNHTQYHLIIIPST